MIYIGADHGGFELKERIISWLSERNLDYTDIGAHKLDPDDDYPQYAFGVAQKVAEKPDENKGILACRSGAGVMIAANKVAGIRAVAPHDTQSAIHSREHNDANVIALSGDFLSPEASEEILSLWLDTAFSEKERYHRRKHQVEEYEKHHLSNS